MGATQQASCVMFPCTLVASVYMLPDLRDYVDCKHDDALDTNTYPGQ